MQTYIMTRILIHGGDFEDEDRMKFMWKYYATIAYLSCKGVHLTDEERRGAV